MPRLVLELRGTDLLPWRSAARASTATVPGFNRGRRVGMQASVHPCWPRLALFEGCGSTVGPCGDRIHGVSRRAQSRSADPPRPGRRRAAPLDRGAEHGGHLADGPRPAVVPRAGAEDRSWVGLIPQAGIRGFVDWFEGGGRTARRPHDADGFGAAPRELAGPITFQRPSTWSGSPSRWSRARRGPRPRRGAPRRAPGPRYSRESRSPPRRSTPGPPRPAAPGTPGSRRSSSTRCSAARSTRRALPSQPWGGTPGTASVVVGSGRPGGPTPTCSRGYDDAGPPPGSTSCPGCRAGASWRCSATSPTRARPRR